MAKPKNSGLGRGLSAIFLENETEGQNVSVLRLSEIDPRAEQPRKSFDNVALAELADSIAANGMIQPIVVRSTDNGRYQIIAGERRWRAAKMAGLTEVPVVVNEMDDKTAAQIALVENLQRQNLNPLEEAMAYSALTEDYGMSKEEVARQIGKNRSTVSNMIRLLDLPEPLRDRLADGRLSAGHARALLPLCEINPSAALDLAQNIELHGLSVRETERLAEKAKKAKPAEKPVVPTVEVDYKAEMERHIMDVLGRTVQIRDQGKKKALVIPYDDNADLDALVALLCEKQVKN